MTTQNLVLVHGGFVDGSGWRGVYDILKSDGYNVTIVQNPTTSLAADVAATRSAIAAQDAGRARRPLLRRRRDHRGRHRSEGRAAGLHRRLRTRRRRVGAVADRQPAARRAGAADPAAAGRLPVPRPGEVRRLLRCRCRFRHGGLHGGLAGALGGGCPGRRGAEGSTIFASRPTGARSRRGPRSSRSRLRCWRVGRSASTPRPMGTSMPPLGCRSASPTRSSCRWPSRTPCRRRATCSAGSTAPDRQLLPSAVRPARCRVLPRRHCRPRARDRGRGRRPRLCQGGTRRASRRRFARGLAPLAVTAWGREPTILGSYSHALPTSADARAVLARPVSPRLCFAGEACSPRDFSTAHGAWETGIAAADQIAAAL